MLVRRIGGSSDPSKRALIIIDLQFCFLPGGSLATNDASDPEASLLVDGISKQVRTGGYTSIYITKDTHTPGHKSFADNVSTQPFQVQKEFYSETKRAWNKSRDQVMWSPHCVCDPNGRAIDGSSDYNTSGQLGCDLPFDVEAIAPPDSNIGYVSKGFEHEVDSYSAIADAKGYTTPRIVQLNDVALANRTFLEHLNERRYDVIDICGIARDKCVLWTAFDLLEFLDYTPTIRFLYALTRPVSAGLFEQNLDITPQSIESIVSTEFPTKSQFFHVVQAPTWQGGQRRRSSPRRASNQRSVGAATTTGGSGRYCSGCRSVRRGGAESRLRPTPTTEVEYQALVDAAILANGRRQPDTSLERISIQIDRQNLFELKDKKLEWLKSNATQPSGLRNFFVNDITWKELVRNELKFDLVG